ncbi:S8 family serine peptidase [Haloarchaeobius sp. DFWS5]|uniref:S8 family serine peptidase n=1 Tax=Haloarchaeobius sp. DFWS5 TaxID=3446114 RepID=UPI003EB79E25
MKRRGWSRRDLLKTTAVGGAVVGLGAAVVERMNRYIVGATDTGSITAAASVSDVQEERIALSEHTGLTLVVGSYSDGRRQSLLSREDIAFVQPDRTLELVSTPSDQRDSDTAGAQVLPWGIDRIDADVAHAERATGAGVDVGIIDGGIDDAHPDLQENLADPSVDGNHRAWVDCQGEDCPYPWSDDGNHGTHVAGTVAADGENGVVGVAPEATLHALKVCGSGGSCRTSDIADAIRHAADEGWDVVNLSLGAPQKAPALQAAGQYARKSGVLLVAAAGNRGQPDSVGYPAAYDEFVAVSATDIDDDIADFSSTGPEVDIAAPGKDVCSSIVDGHRVNNGTSMASPHVAGAAAQLLAAGHSQDEVVDQLTETAEDLGKSTDEQGAGLLDVAKALDYDSSDNGTGDGTSCPSQ